MIINNSKKEKVEFPEGKIVLLDGTELECIPRAEAISDDAVSEELRGLFPNDDISFSTIEEYIHKNRNPQY